MNRLYLAFCEEAILLNDSKQTFRLYGSWKGLTATTGELASSFSNLRLGFSASVADGGQPGFTTPEELLLGAAVAAYATAFTEVSLQMAIDLAGLEIEAELVRDFDEIEGNRIREIWLKPVAQLRTGIGFEKVHDMFRRAVGLARQRSPVLLALEPTIRIRLEADFGQVK